MTSYEHLQRIYEESEPFVKWSESQKNDVFSMIEKMEKQKELSQKMMESEGLVIKSISRLMFDLGSPENSLEKFKSFYGFSNKPNMYPNSLKEKGLKYYTDEHKAIVEDVAFGILPTVFAHDHNENEAEYLRLANAFAFKIDKNCYVAAITTQLSKFLTDWSIIVGSTSLDNNNKIKYFIPLVDIPDALSYLVKTRWLNEEAPPTWGMKFTPEELAKNPFWLLTSRIMSHATHFFFIHHEIAHVVLGHLENNKENDGICKVRHNNEFDADIYSAHITANHLKEAFEALDKQMDIHAFIQIACIAIIRILTFLEILDQFGDAKSNTHPAGSLRAKEVANIFCQYFPQQKNMFKYYIEMSPVFNELVKKGL